MTEDIQSINEINLMKLQIEVRLTWGQKYEGKKWNWRNWINRNLNLMESNEEWRQDQLSESEGNLNKLMQWNWN